KTTPNGHTIGASTYIPDSSVAQWTEDVELETVDANGDPITETIEVRAYDEAKNDMYRFARHHGHSEATGGNRRNYVPIGPLALRCMSCHQPHNADAMTWQPEQVTNYAGVATFGSQDSYKLLRQFPSGTFVGGLDGYGQIPIGNISLVPETTLTAGVNFDNARAMGADPGALNLVRGSTSRAYNRPMWVAQGFDGDHDRNEYLAEEAIASAVNNAALSVWCADCHNLNIGGWEHLANPELGFKAHTERTHPAPYTGSHYGPGQCYSCHRNDLPRKNTGDSCSQCHYGTGAYFENRIDEGGAEYVASDFPHSGEDGDYKMLGSYSVVPIAAYGDSATTIDETVTVGPDNLDAVCLRCHGGIGTYH
ncbi:MAG: cytochrome c3 family protein, partial [Coriobacteriia bacterium]|nr:cytochrome c3 family protein [Coriobacteriia bacterium]